MIMSLTTTLSNQYLSDDVRMTCINDVAMQGVAGHHAPIFKQA